ncbi:MAG: hypothetical protein MUQ00_10200 [Candidatus Aminicenantes bacterium]|nr:hypothetical protein [Candidatus Aminicenantes bacterium]
MKRGFLIAGLIAAAVLGPRAALTRPQPVRTDNAAWKSIGPDGGCLRDLAVNPGNPNDLLAVFDSTPSQIYRTTNGGNTWKRISLFGDTILSIAFGPQGSGRLYALGWSSVYCSRNGGSSWTRLSNPQGFAGLERLASHPSNPNGLFILGRIGSETTALGLARTTDGGRTWKAKRISPEGNAAESFSLCVHPRNASVIYLSGFYRTSSTSKYVISRSTNGGDSWQDISAGITSKVFDLAADPNNPSQIYAATEWGVYRSSDAGQTWRGSSDYSYAYGVVVDPTNSSVIYAGYQKRIYKSTDGGVTWTAIEGGLAGNCRRMAVAGNAVLFGSRAGIYRSANAGATWAAAQTGIRAGLVPSFFVAPSSPNVLYANVADRGFYQSDRFGRTWSLLPYFYSCDDQGRIAAVDPGNPRTLYMIAPGQG